MNRLTEPLLDSTARGVPVGTQPVCALLRPMRQAETRSWPTRRSDVARSASIIAALLLVLALVYALPSRAQDLVFGGIERSPEALADEALALQNGLGGALGANHSLIAVHPGVILWDELPGRPPTQLPGGNQRQLHISTTMIRR